MSRNDAQTTGRAGGGPARLVGISVLALAPVVCGALAVAWPAAAIAMLGLGALFAGAMIVVVIRCVRAMSQAQRQVLTDIGEFAHRIESADTRALELTLRMLTDVGEASNEAHNASGIMGILDASTKSAATTAAELNGAVSAAAAATDQISANIQCTAADADRISENMTAVAATVEQMSASYAMVEAAVRDLSRAIEDVSKGARDGAAISVQAADSAHGAREVMSALGRSADEIGHVTGVIKVIAQQTNLLSLNAAIEAANAGESGAGFAVVAGEVKELARQTAAATADIEEKILRIQQGASRAIKAIQQISDINDKMASLQQLVSDRAEQQSRAAGEITSNVAAAAAGISEIAQKINESAQGAARVSDGLTEVADASNEVARTVTEAAGGVASLSESVMETSVMITEANRYIERTARASMHCNGGIGEMSEVVDSISDTVQAMTRVTCNGSTASHA